MKSPFTLATPLHDRMFRVDSNSPNGEETRLDLALAAPIVTSYNDQIRPLLDAIDRLRHLQVMQEGIELPTIVVVGDQSSGKSSVLESLAGISLPRGQGICTRVPLIMRLQNYPTDEPQFQLEFHGKIVSTDEVHIVEAINVATEEIAGNGKCISHTPLTLLVKKRGVPDLTMVDLPGITRVPVHGQPDDIYEQISTIIMEYIKPKQSIILNVLSATVDFPTCESIRMSQSVDKTGERTLAVVTKVDKTPEGLLEKVTADDVNIGLGYVCVRNRVGDESYEEARIEEAKLFKSHPLLSKIDKSIVGIPVLAQKLVQIQASSILKYLPDIVTKINDKLGLHVSELKRMPQNLSTTAEAITALVHLLGSAKESLKKILLRGEFEEYPEDTTMHCTARMAEMLDKYSEELQSRCVVNTTDNFLMEEIKVLEEAKGIVLPNFIPLAAFRTILQRKVKEVSLIPNDFVRKVWHYIEDVTILVLKENFDNYPQLLSPTTRAARNLVAKMRECSFDKVKEIVEMEKHSVYTCNPEYNSTWSKLMEQRSALMVVVNEHSKTTKLNLEGFGVVELGHLRQYKMMVEQAFDIKMRITAYWKIVLQRLVDYMALHIQVCIQKMVNEEIEKGIIKELMGGQNGGLQRMLEETASVASKRERLNQSIKLLTESKEVVANLLDRIAVYGD